MPQVINTNVASLTAQRNLSKSQNTLNTSLQRLSSGLRINSAKDDAAGLAISERMTAQINGLSQASRNANDGISLAQTAEGALGEIGTNLQRIRELSAQSANATNSAEDRAALQSEVTALIDEIDRVANQTSFNGTKLLDGSFTSKLFQVGADAGQTIGINSVVDANVDKLGAAQFSGTTQSTNAVASGSAATTAGTVSGISINNVTIDTVDIEVGDTAADAQTKIVNAINEKSDQTGVYASLDTAGKMTLTSVIAGQALDVTVPATSSATGLGVDFSGIADTTLGAAQQMNDIDITSFGGAQQALEIVDAALTTVNAGRADLGAIQNRFSSTISNLTTSSENLSASRSRIQDADFAVETSNLTKAQILQQAGTAMLAQAKALPQQVLSLLQ